jgi:large subunit ribosomal protein L2
MAVKRYQPTTPGRRHAGVLVSGATRGEREKRLTFGRRSQAGRNNQGKITVRHRGGGVKRILRTVDFERTKYDVPARVASIEYDPNRTANLALLVYRDGDRRYMVAPNTLAIGQIVVSSQKPIDIKPGNRLPLKHVPTGLQVHNIELTPRQGGVVVRSAGSWATLMSVEGGMALLKFPSGEIRKVPEMCSATIGQVGNVDFANVRLGKAGRRRHMGFRPSVRGKAMNPVDHPHGGGEGHNPIGMKHPKTPWGKPAMGVPTRRPSKASNRFIVSRRAKKR